MENRQTAKRPRTKIKVGTSNVPKSNRLLIETNVQEYERRLKKHREYLDSLEHLIRALSQFKQVDIKEADKIIENPVLFAEKTVLKSKQEVNTMGLSYHKLVDVLELDTIELEMRAREFAKLNPNDYYEPSVDDFKVYTSKVEQVQRLEALQGIIQSVNAIKSIESDWNIQKLKSGLIQSFKGRLVSTPEAIFEPKPSLRYVLTGKAI